MKTALAALFTSLLAAPAMAQSQCAPFQEISDGLMERFSESVVAVGGSDRGHQLTIFASPDGATWTVVGLLPDGMGCVFDSGSSYVTQDPATPAAPSKGS